jgi:hypothetical protein
VSLLESQKIPTHNEGYEESLGIIPKTYPRAQFVLLLFFFPPMVWVKTQTLMYYILYITHYAL